MSEILDSGNRRKFESGAVRDISEGKGRMDLVPLDIVANLYSYIEENDSSMIREFCPDLMLRMMNNFNDSGSTHFIYYQMWSFIQKYYDSVEDAILDVSIHYEQGAQKYEERNWEKGIPCHCYVDSAVRHCLKFLRGDKDERHDRAYIWNLLGLLWTIRHKPEFNDLLYTKLKSEKVIASTRSSSKLTREKECQSIIDELNRFSKLRSRSRSKEKE